MTMCVYCGEYLAHEKIPDPNGGGGHWLVCKYCKDIIHAQWCFAFSEHLGLKEEAERFRREIERISEESGVPSTVIEIRKKEKTK